MLDFPTRRSFHGNHHQVFGDQSRPPPLSCTYKSTSWPDRIRIRSAPPSKVTARVQLLLLSFLSPPSTRFFSLGVSPTGSARAPEADVYKSHRDMRDVYNITFIYLEPTAAERVSDPVQHKVPPIYIYTAYY